MVSARLETESSSPFEDMATRLRLKAYRWQDPRALPPREWLYGTHLCRGYVSTRVAAGGVGKTSLNLADALAMASGKSLLGYEPFGVLNVFYWGEDPAEELQRRLEATRQFYGLEPHTIEGLIYLHSARDLEIKTAVRSAGGVQIVGPVHDALVREFKACEVDVAMIDPFVSSHSVVENDNGHVDMVTRQWSSLAADTQCAIDLTHHLRKAAGHERTVEDARGGGSIIAAVRDAQLLLKMAAEDAATMGVPDDDAWRHFRISDGKANMAPPASRSDWFRLESVSLDNGTDDRPADHVGVVTRWKPTSAFDGVSRMRIDAAMRELEREPRRMHPSATQWAGHTIGKALEIDTSTKAGKARIGRMIDQWLSSGALEAYEGQTSKRETKIFIRPGRWEYSTPEAGSDDE